jgi:hypothetical protein
MAALGDYKIRKLDNLVLRITVTRELKLRVRAAIWLVRLAALILGGELEVNSDGPTLPTTTIHTHIHGDVDPEIFREQLRKAMRRNPIH